MDPSTPDSHARAVIAAYRTGERMPTSDREAAWQRLTAAIADPPLLASTRHTRGRWLAGGAVLLAAAALLLLASTLRRDLGRHTDAATDLQASHDLDPAARQTTRTRSPTGQLAPLHPLDSAPPPHEPTTRDPPPRSTSSTPSIKSPELGAELTLLRDARAALAGADPQQALRLLDAHQQRFPGGLLAEERMVLRVQALCDAGFTERAHQAAQEFTRAYPASPHLATCDR